MVVNCDQYGHPLPRCRHRSRITDQYERVITFAADKYGHVCSGERSSDNVPALGSGGRPLRRRRELILIYGRRR